MIHNECSVCGKDFGSVKAFDRHRVGRHEYLFEEGLRLTPPREDGRRCLSSEEMLAGSYGKDGKRYRFALSTRGTWSLAEDLERLRSRSVFSDHP